MGDPSKRIPCLKERVLENLNRLLERWNIVDDKNLFSQELLQDVPKLTQESQNLIDKALKCEAPEEQLMAILVEVDSTGRTRCASPVKAGPIRELLNLPSKLTATCFLISAVIAGSLKWEKVSRALAGCPEPRASIEIMSPAEVCQELALQASHIRILVVELAEADSEVMTRTVLAWEDSNLLAR